MKCEGCPLVNPPCSDGVGNPNAKIAIVGRNPGRTEARTGVPFTGPSGELLDATLEDIGLKRDDLWITNAAMCHIEGDESPTEEMFAACRPRLIEELRSVNPDVILTLGNDATQAMIGKSQGSVSKLIGTMQLLPDLNKWIIPTHHPAFILRGNVEAFDDMKDGLERAKRLATGEQPFPSPLPRDKVHYCNTVEKAIEALRTLTSKDILAIDTETDTVNDPNMKLLLVQMGDGVDAWVFEADLLIEKGMPRALFQEMLEDSNRIWFLHNAAFDLSYIRHYWGEIEGTVEDTMMLALCLSEHLRHCGLKYLVNKYLSVPHYETEIHKYLTHKGVTFSAIPREVLVPYAGYDVIFTFQLYYKLLERVKAEGNYYNLYPMLVECQKLFSEMQYYGIKVDPSYVELIRNEYEPLVEKLLVEIQDYAYLKGFRASQVVKNNKSYEFLNPLSPVQLKYFVNTYEGYKTETTGSKWAVEHEEENEFVAMLQRWKKVEHLLRVYVEGIVDDTWPDGKVHPGFVHGAVTGRTTIEHPPMQTIPSDDFAERYNVLSVRKLFIAEPGHKFVHFDYSQLEIRVGWHITEDENLGRAVMQPDMHRYMASLVWRKPPDKVTDYERGQSKTVTFGMLYGRQAPSIARQMHVSVEEAQAFFDSFAVQFPQYFQWWEGTKERAIEQGYLETVFGRRRRWNLITDDIAAEIMRQAVNFPIQSTATDICLSSMIKVSKLLKQRNVGRVLFSVHDSIEMQIKEECVEELAPIIENIMTHPFEKSVAIFKVKMGIADNFAEASDA